MTGASRVPYTSPAIPARNAWRNLHGDLVCSDEVSLALAPAFHEAWTAEAATYNVTGPVFDSAGNLSTAAEPVFTRGPSARRAARETASSPG